MENVKTETIGCLFGLMYKGTLLILGFNVESTPDTINYKQIQDNFPAELDLCGLVKFGLCTDSQEHLNEIFQVLIFTISILCWSLTFCLSFFFVYFYSGS